MTDIWTDMLTQVPFTEIFPKSSHLADLFPTLNVISNLDPTSLMVCIAWRVPEYLEIL